MTDKIETEIPLGKWDDSVLIDTWNLALAEYNVNIINTVIPTVKVQLCKSAKTQ